MKRIKRPFIEMTGRRFGRLLVLHQLDTDKPGTLWLCKCDCGTEKEVSGGTLRSANCRSCGCFRREQKRKQWGLPEGVAARNDLYGRYKAGAKKRKLDWKLESQSFLDLTQQPCYYCGSAPQTILRYKCKDTMILFTGIDRVDSKKGYVAGNIVPCCELCNKAKRNLPLAAFEAWLDRIATFRLRHRGTEAYTELKHIMEVAIPLQVPVYVGEGVGADWSEAH